jgi:hypothetical protein
VAAVPSVARTLALDHPLYGNAELIEAQNLAIRPLVSARRRDGIGTGKLPCRFALCSRTRNGLAHARSKTQATAFDRRNFIRAISFAYTSQSKIAPEL